MSHQQTFLEGLLIMMANKLGGRHQAFLLNESMGKFLQREKELKTGFGRQWLKREYAADRLAASRQAGESRSWWATVKSIAENNYNLAAGRYKPQIVQKVPDEDPAELIRETLAIEHKIAEGLERLLKEINAT